jgi:exopolysaccharide production protein ExoY
MSPVLGSASTAVRREADHTLVKAAAEVPIRLGVTTPFAERCLALAALAAALPALLCSMIAVRILSGRSPLIALKRVGQDGVPFWLLKLRTMWEGPRGGTAPGWVERLEETEIPVAKGKSDPRVTSRFAALLRRFSIDELPQFLHVVQGRMRLAGPRPLTRLELDLFYGAAAAEILRVPPGITGLWQVMGRNRLSYKQRLRLDLFLVRRGGPALYLGILVRTPGSVLRGNGAF